MVDLRVVRLGDCADRVRGHSMIRALWFTAGFLLGVVTTTLGLLWMMARAVVG
jgi:demethoxyubiquinone hydroxylase (CLK1/Coq7/Cat5 family)